MATELKHGFRSFLPAHVRSSITNNRTLFDFVTFLHRASYVLAVANIRRCWLSDERTPCQRPMDNYRLNAS